MRYTILLSTAFLYSTALPAQEAPALRLAVKGQPQLPIVIANEAPEKIAASADTLASHLAKITGGEFKVIKGDGATGIALGRPEDFPALKLKLPRDASDPFAQEDYLLRSHDKGLHLIGATEQAIEHAVWDLLHRMGHRQFFPGPTWEVIPGDPNLSVRVNHLEQPSFHSRRIWELLLPREILARDPK